MRLLKDISSFLILTALVGLSLSSHAQNMSINNSGALPDGSAMLDVSDTASGFLMPRMTSSQRSAIVNPANGLLIFQTDTNRGVWMFDSVTSAWQKMINALDTTNVTIDTLSENHLSARINNNGTTATVAGSNANFISSVTRLSSGLVRVRFVSGTFSAEPAITATVIGNYINSTSANAHTVSLDSVDFETIGSASNFDTDFYIKFSRQGSDYTVNTTGGSGSSGPDTTYSILGLPVGTILPFGGDTSSIPNGYLLCNGMSLDTGQFSGLFAAIDYSWGGAGANFNIPDLRGRFIRGTDLGAGNDPDASSRIVTNTGGNTGDAVGTLQDHELENHTHSFARSAGGSGSSTGTIRDNVYNNITTEFWGATGGNETRPVNVNVNYIICYDSEIASQGGTSSAGTLTQSLSFASPNLSISGGNTVDLSALNYEDHSLPDTLGIHLMTGDLIPNGNWILGDGDPNEGIYLNFSGDVGLNTGTPVTTLHVYDDTQSRIRVTSADSTWTGIEMKNNEADFRIYSDRFKRLLFRDHSGTTNLTRMVIDSNGRVGIGSTVPTSKLQVDGDFTLIGNDTSRIFNLETANREILGIRGKSTVTDGAGINVYGGNDLLYPRATRFLSGGSSNASMWIDSAENVAIGNQVPTERLDVAGNVKADSLIIYDGTNAPSSGDVLTAVDANGRAYWSPASSLTPGLSQVLAVDSSANGRGMRDLGPVAIGGADVVSEQLTVHGDTINAITLEQTDNLSNSHGISWQNAANSYTWAISREDAGSNNADLVFRGGNTPTNPMNLNRVLTLQTGGNVGIHTPSPAAPLHVLGNHRVETQRASNLNAFSVTDSTDGSAIATIGAGSAGNANLRLYDSTGTLVTQIAGGGFDSYFNNVGNLAIGHTDPDTKLDVQGRVIFRSNSIGQTLFRLAKLDDSPLIEFYTTTPSRNPGLLMRDSLGNSHVRIATGGASTFFDNNDQAMVFGAADAAAISPFNIVDSTGNNVVRFSADDAGNNDVRLRFDQRGASRWFMGYDASNSYFKFSEGTWANPMMVIDSATSFVGIGTDNPTTLLSLLGNGATAEVGITQNLVGGGSSMELTTEDASSVQTTRFLIGGGSNNANLRVYTGASGSETEYVRFDGANQRVGIGETTPLSKLHVVGNMRLDNTYNLFIENSLGTAYNAITGNASDQLVIGNQNWDEVRIHGGGSNDVIYIDNGAQVGIGTNNPIRQLDVVDDGASIPIARFENTNTGANGDGIAILSGANTPGTGNAYITFVDGSNGADGAITGSGLGGVLYSTTSDRRLKMNIQDLENALEVIQQMQPRSYERKVNPGVNEQGFIAQELIKVYPQAVSGSPDDPVETPMGVDYSQLTPLLTKGIQELNVLIEELRVQNANQQEEIEQLKRELRNFKKNRNLHAPFIQNDAD